jgi:hypothetical protein
MIRPGFLARVAVGAAVYALEETRKLPATALSLPMNAVSQVLQTAMHAQQFVASLAIKGDAALEPLLGGAEEQPAWATFDDDAADTANAAQKPNSSPDAPSTNGHVPESVAEPINPEPATPAEVVARLDYPTLTLAQLRARLRYLTVDELAALLDYEQSDLARAPFVTMLTNRIATATAAAQ